jgi:hypothetical protein
MWWLSVLKSLVLKTLINKQSGYVKGMWVIRAAVVSNVAGSIGAWYAAIQRRLGCLIVSMSVGDMALCFSDVQALLRGCGLGSIEV